jgi:hypothetical protein
VKTAGKVTPGRLHITWGHYSEFEHFERELWTGQSSFNGADEGVVYREALWRGEMSGGGDNFFSAVPGS